LDVFIDGFAYFSLFPYIIYDHLKCIGRLRATLYSTTEKEKYDAGSAEDDETHLLSSARTVSRVIKQELGEFLFACRQEHPLSHATS
jgi:hypothetical protein